MSEYSEDLGEAAVANEAASIPDDQLDAYIASLVGDDEVVEDESSDAEEVESDGEEPAEEVESTESVDEDSDDSEDSASEEDEEPAEETEEEESPEVPEGLERVLAPFKANGKMIQVDNVDDAISLMQMGANYSEKMHSLKPHLKTIRMLEQQGAMDESILHTLLDAKNGNAEAIRKLIVDAKIDPTDLLDIDPDNPVDYNPKDYAISDTQYEFQNVLKDLESSEHYTPTLDVVSSWDERSRAKMYEDPSILQGLHAVIAGDHFEKIQTHLSTLRTLGKVPAGMTDVDAFGMAAQMLDERGELGAAPQQTQQKRIQPKRDEKIIERKRAAAPAKGRKAVPKAKGTNLDFAKMTDEEFSKAYDAGLFKQITQ